MALDYLQKGYSAIPDKQESKFPAVEGWNNYSSKLPSPEEVNQWCSIPKTNISLVLGEASGIIVLDLDTDDSEFLKKINHLLPTSPVERKGSKGWARFFQFSGEANQELFEYYEEDGIKKKRVFLELLSHGKKITIPPSIHPKGMEYQWTKIPLLSIRKEDLPIFPAELFTVLSEILALEKTSVFEFDKISAGRNMSLSSYCSELIRDRTDIETAVQKLIEFDIKHSEKPLFSDPNENKTPHSIINASKFFANHLESINIKRFKNGLEPELPLGLLNPTLSPTDEKPGQQNSLVSLPSPKGILKDIQEYILERSYVEQPVFALGAAVILLGTIVSRKMIFQGTTPNIYMLNIAQSGCVDSETEFLSPSGWIKISDWNNEKVLQYDSDLEKAEFVTPLDYIKIPCKEMLHFKTKYGVDQMLSEEHRVLYEIINRPNLNIKTAKEIQIRHNKSKKGFSGRFRTTFSSTEMPDVDLTDAELRLQIAFLADGTIPKTSRRPNIQVKKQFKKDRLKFLLELSKTEYTRNDYSSGYSRFKFYPPLTIKRFTELGSPFIFSKKQLEIILSESLLWDGDRVKIYRSSIKTEADYIQLVAALLGKRASISCDQREGHGICYSVHICGNNTVGIASNTKQNIKLVPSTDGFKYCFSVPSTFLILRRNGNIFITGNSGKDSCQQALKSILTAISANDLIGAASYPSEASILVNLSSQPVRLDIVDEASSFLKSASYGGAAYQTGIGDVLCELFSCSNEKYLGKILASNGGKRVGDCNRPNINLICSTTPKGISEGISQATLEKGLFARFLTFFGESHKPAKRIKTMVPISQKIISTLQSWYTFSNPDSDGDIEINKPAYSVRCEPEAEDLLDKYFYILDEKRTSQQTNLITLPIASRLFQQMMKLVLIHAVSTTNKGNLPKVKVVDVEFGFQYINYFYQSIDDFVTNTVHDDNRSANVNKMLQLIKRHGSLGITQIDITKNTRGMKPLERVEIVNELVTTELIGRTSEQHNGVSIYRFFYIGD